MLQSRRFACLLHIHAEVNQIAEHLDVALRLHIAAHDPKDEPGFAVLRHQRGNDRMEGPSVRLQAISMVGIEGEERAAVLQGEA